MLFANVIVRMKMRYLYTAERNVGHAYTLPDRTKFIRILSAIRPDIVQLLTVHLTAIVRPMHISRIKDGNYTFIVR
jgi:hypothetical protein